MLATALRRRRCCSPMRQQGRRCFSSSDRLSHRARALAAGGGAAARVWEEVNALASQPGMVNMGQGFPDFAGSAVARDVASEALQGGSAALNQYSPQPGLLALRESIASFQTRRYGASYDAATEVIVTAGAQEGLAGRHTGNPAVPALPNFIKLWLVFAAAFAAFLDPGDEVLLFEPFYPFMLGAVRLAGAVPRVVTLHSPEFAIDTDKVAQLVAESPKVKMLVLNSPHNPTGHVASATELEAIAKVCVAHDLIAVADEVYEHSVFPSGGGDSAPSSGHMQLAASPGMRERTITLG